MPYIIKHDSNWCIPKLCETDPSHFLYIYILSDIAEETLSLLKKEDINIDSVIVSEVSSNIWRGYKVISVDDLYDKGVVIISVTSKWRQSIECKLKDSGNETIFITK